MDNLNETLKGIELPKEQKEAIVNAFKKDNEGLLNNRNQFRDQFDELKNLVGSLTNQEKGVDKNNLQDYFNKLEQDSQMAKALEEQINQAKGQFEETLNKVKGDYEGQIQALMSEKKDSLLNSTLDSVISEKGVTGVKAKALKSLLRAEASIEQDGSNYQVKFNSENGLVDTDEYMSKFWESDGKEFLPNNNAGGGSFGGNGGNGQGANYKLDMSQKDKFELIKQKMNQ